ncbi:MAG: arsenate reductase ArsC [Acidimicrobiaceae bacterium]|nr:arsenate reductase ArsC [Acidimicrobiaceae bacterium]
MTTPTVLFVCVHNAGRSQMAAALLERHGAGAINVLSAGTAPADEVHPIVAESMAELGIDLTTRQPRVLSPELAREADVVITMGCGDTCPVFPGKRYLDWELEDPKGKSLAEVRVIRDDIDRRVRELVEELRLNLLHLDSPTNDA